MNNGNFAGPMPMNHGPTSANVPMHRPHMTMNGAPVNHNYGNGMIPPNGNGINNGQMDPGNAKGNMNGQVVQGQTKPNAEDKGFLDQYGAYMVGAGALTISAAGLIYLNGQITTINEDLDELRASIKDIQKHIKPLLKHATDSSAMNMKFQNISSRLDEIDRENERMQESFQKELKKASTSDGGLVKGRAPIIPTVPKFGTIEEPDYEHFQSSRRPARPTSEQLSSMVKEPEIQSRDLSWDDDDDADFLGGAL